MKLLSIQVVPCFCSILLAVFFVAAFVHQPLAGQQMHMVRLPVDPTIVDLSTLTDDPSVSGTVVPQGNNAARSATPNETTPSAQKSTDARAAKGTPEAGEPVDAEKTKVVKTKPAQALPHNESKTPEPVKVTPAGTPAANAVTAMTLEQARNHALVLRVQANKGIGRVTYLRLSAPSRLVVDIHGQWTLRAKNVVRLQASDFSHLVAGEHSDRLRLVLHCRNKKGLVPVPSVSVQQHTVAVSIPSGTQDSPKKP